MTTLAEVKKPKTAYTEEQTAELLQDWNMGKGATIEQLAEKFGKTAKSIISKLSREKVYTAKAYVSKTGEKPVKKDETADAIGLMLNLPENDTESLTKANKSALAKISNALAHSVPLEVLTPVNEETRNNFAEAIGKTFSLDASECNSLRRVPFDTLKVLHDGIQAFDFLNDVRVSIDNIVEQKMAKIADDVKEVNEE